MPFEKSSKEEKQTKAKPAKPGKRARRRLRKRETKKVLKEAQVKQAYTQAQLQADLERKKKEQALIEKDPKLKTTLRFQEPLIEYVPDAVLSTHMPYFDEFKKIFSRFATPQDLTAPKRRDEDEDKEFEVTKTKKDTKKAEEGEEDKTNASGDKKLSRRERKLRTRLSVAVLKQSCERPDLVEVHDANSIDPKLLVMLKSYRNTVPVPPHWLQKRKYLQNKRGIEKQPFELPDFIAATGITKIRAAQQEKDEHMKLRQRMRQKMQPKMGRTDIDYQTLHDAFFRYQTKPKMTSHGDLYFEGKEFEVKLKSKIPGELSEEIMRALGMANGKLSPPPWLFNMQRFGPPPSYANLKIPGVNAPIPEGTRYGYGEGEWGTPPTDEYGRPLYGDVFGTEKKFEDIDDEEPVSKILWGQIADEEEQEEEEEEESGEEEEVEEVEEQEEVEKPISMDGTESTTSVASGLETPEQLQLRKKEGTGTETPDTVERPKSLYTVLEEKQTAVSTTAMFGSAHTYVLPSASAAPAAQGTKTSKKPEIKKAGEVEVAFTPEELESLDAATLKRKYENQVETEKAATRAERQEVADVIEEESRKKRKKPSSKDKKKYKF